MLYFMSEDFYVKSTLNKLDKIIYINGISDSEKRNILCIVKNYVSSKHWKNNEMVF